MGLPDDDLTRSPVRPAPDLERSQGAAGGGSTTLLTLERGLAVLETVSAADGQITAKVLGRRLGLRLGTCYHLLRTLVASGYLKRTAEGCYDVGPRAAALSLHVQQSAERPLPGLAVILATLHQRTGETAYQAGLHHDRIVFQGHLGGRRLSPNGEHDARTPKSLHVSATGKALLASLPQQKRIRLLEKSRSAPSTEHTARYLGDLVRELEVVRRAGIAIDREGCARGTSCASSPFFGRSGELVGTFTVTTSARRFRQRYDPISASLRQAAADATRVLRSTPVGPTPLP